MEELWIDVSQLLKLLGDDFDREQVKSHLKRFVTKERRKKDCPKYLL
jgi:hypothetical protein